MKKYNLDENNIYINFSQFPFCFRCVSFGNYTNKLRDSKQFFEYFKRTIEKDIPFYSQYTFSNITNASNKHSHSIPVNSKQYNLIIEIVKELYKSYKNNSCSERDLELFISNNISNYHIWQLGVSGGIRLIGIRNSNIFNVIFIDHHHLIYDDKNYNDKNYELYDFCPITNYIKGGNV